MNTTDINTLTETNDIFEKKSSIFIKDKMIEDNDFYYRVQQSFHAPDIIKNYGNIGFDIFKNYDILVNYDRMEFDIKKATP